MNKRIYKGLLLLIVLFISIESFSQSTVCNYKYRKRITFDPTKVTGATDLVDYTALINILGDPNLALLANSGHVETAGGLDIIFTAADGVTLLSFQREYYASAASSGSLVAWVKIPLLSTSITTDIYMYYGLAAASDLSSTSAWNSNYKGAYFFHSDYNDKSTGGNNGTNAGFASVTGTIGNGISSSAVTNSVSIGCTGWSSTNGTYECWIYGAGSWNAVEGYFLGHTTIPSYNNRVQIYGYNGSLRVGIGNSHAIGGDLFAFTLNRWYHVAVMHASGNHTVCVNGATVYVGSYATFTAVNTVASVGNDGNSGTNNEAQASGRLDNMFISNVNRGVNWVSTCYNNQSSPSTFYSIGAEPKVWTGATNTNYNAATNWLNNSTPSAGNDVIINNGANQPTLQGNEQMGGLMIRAGAILSLGANSLSVRYDITNCGTLSNNTGTVVCNSTSAYCQTQYFSGTGTFNLKGLTVNNTFATNPNLTLNAPVTINGDLALASGTVFTTATNILAVSSTGASGSGSSTSFVSGPMSKTGSTDFIFPVGKGNKWRRCAVTNMAASDTYTAEYFNSSYASTTPVTAPLNHVSVVEYWMCTRAGAANAKLTLYWEDASVSGITNCPDLTIARWNGAGWDERAGTASGSCSGTGVGSVITNAQLAAFSPFTFASHLSWAINPLPISLLTFNATPINEDVRIDWSTVSEKNNDHFIVQRSQDGINFDNVGTLAGNGTTNNKNSYSLIDSDPYKGLSYYRLAQIDANSTINYTSLVPINFDTKDLVYSIYPNPNKGEFTISGNVAGAEVSIYNAIGQKIEHNINSQNATNINVSCKALPEGVYFVTIKTATVSKTQKLVIE